MIETTTAEEAKKIADTYNSDERGIVRICQGIKRNAREGVYTAYTDNPTEGIIEGLQRLGYTVTGGSKHTDLYTISWK